MTTYREILKRAWHQTWSDKTLWFFGLLAAFLGVGGGITKGLDLTGGQSILINLWQTLMSVKFFSWQTIKNFPTLFLASPISFIILSLVVLIIVALALILLILAILSQATIINSVGKRDAGKKASYSQGLSLGLNKFWSLLALNFIAKLAVGLTFLFLLYVAIRVSSWQLLLAAFIYCVLLIITVIVSLVIRYAICHLVLNNDKILPSLKRGKELFFANWLVTLEVVFILFLFELFILFLARIFITLDVFILYFVLIAVNLLHLTILSKITIFLYFLTITIITLFFISFFAVFSWATWTILIREIEQKNIFSLIKNWLGIS